MSTVKILPHPDPEMLDGKTVAGRSLRPRDAATLIVLRNDGKERRVMMGKRHEAHAFMPNKFVFPGGRLDLGDCRLTVEHGLHPTVEEKLLLKMRGRPNRSRAQGLGLAAIREAFEETGLIIGQKADKTPRTSDPSWQTFFGAGYVPDLSGLRYFARAITPPGRPRRFDARFFVIDASHVVNVDNPYAIHTEELLDRYWLTFDEARKQELPWITREILRMLEEALNVCPELAPDHGVHFQRMQGANWVFETL